MFYVSIIYSKSGTLDEEFAPLVEELMRFRLSMGQINFFCCTYDSCGMLYLFMKNRLGQEFTDPTGSPDRAHCRMIDMYTACTHPEVKEQVLKEYCDTH